MPRTIKKNMNRKNQRTKKKQFKRTNKKYGQRKLRTNKKQLRRKRRTRRKIRGGAAAPKERSDNSCLRNIKTNADRRGLMLDDAYYLILPDEEKEKAYILDRKNWTGKPTIDFYIERTSYPMSDTIKSNLPGKGIGPPDTTKIGNYEVMVHSSKLPEGGVGKKAIIHSLINEIREH